MTKKNHPTLANEQLRKHCKIQLHNSRMYYNSIGKVYCPCLGVYISFNAQGFHHFKYHGGGEARTIRNIVHKLRLLPLVIPVIKQSTSVSEYEKTIEPKNRNSRRPQKEVEYWTIVSCVGRNRDIKIKIVLKRIGAGNIIFWSVIKLKK